MTKNAWFTGQMQDQLQQMDVFLTLAYIHQPARNLITTKHKFSGTNVPDK